MWQKIGGFFYHYLVIIWPYLMVIGLLVLILLFFFYLGRLVERWQWRKEIKNGKRLGEMVREQLKKRDDRIKHLTREIVEVEDRIDRVGVKHKRIIGLSQEIVNVAISENIELLRRRKRNVS